MNREQILALKPGPDLDNLVRTHVTELDERYRPGGDDNQPFSSSIAAAWPLLLWMKDTGAEPELDAGEVQDDFCLAFHSGLGYEKVRTPTAEHGICLAFLLTRAADAWYKANKEKSP